MRQGPHQAAQKSINTYFPLKDVIFTSVLLVLFNAIDGIVSHPDTTQPYFKLLPMLRGEVDLTVDPLIVSSNSLIKEMIHVKELDMTLPMYHQWPSDLETK